MGKIDTNIKDALDNVRTAAQGLHGAISDAAAKRGGAAIILLRKDLGVLADGVREGRKTFVNILKYMSSRRWIRGRKGWCHQACDVWD
jgi:magnesium-transporting ATPase (P-type)